MTVPMTETRVREILAASGKVAREESTPPPARSPVRFDGTINLGHILTAAAMLTAGASAYFNLDKRVELQARDIADVDKRAQDSATQVLKALDDLRDQVKDTSRTVNSIQNDVALLRGRAAAEPGHKR